MGRSLKSDKSKKKTKAQKHSLALAQAALAHKRQLEKEDKENKAPKRKYDERHGDAEASTPHHAKKSRRASSPQVSRTPDGILKSKVEELQKRVYAGNRRVKSLQTKISSLTEQNSTLREKNEELTNTVADLEVRLQEREEVFNVLSADLSWCRQELLDQRRKLDLSTFRAEEYRDKLARAERQYQKKLQDIQNEADRVLQQYINRLNVSESKRAELTKVASKLRRQVRSITERVERAVAADRRKQARLGFKCLQSKAAYTNLARRMVMTLERAGCSQKNIGETIAEVARLLGVPVKHVMSRRTVRRCILEGGVAATLQVGHMIANASAITLSADGTSHKKINYESRHIALRDTGSGRFEIYFLGVDASKDHSSQTQFEGWKQKIEDIRNTYNNSPLARRNGTHITEEHVPERVNGTNGDHANDQKKTASLIQKWKLTSGQRSLGLKYLYEKLSTDELIDAIVPEWAAKVESLGGLAEWIKLSAEDRAAHQRQVERAAALRIGKEIYENLSDAEKRDYELFFRGGCCMHKDLNGVKGAAKALQLFWTLAGLVPPILLANKENAAVLADSAAAATEAGLAAALSSGRGAAKAASLGGQICKNSDTKKGQQRLFSFFTQGVVGYPLEYPDTSNTRYGSYCDASAMIVVYLPVFIEFMEFVRDKKDKPGFTNMELNFYKALKDVPTVTEFCIFAIYGQAISHPYISAVRGSGEHGDKDTNVLDLGPLHLKLLAHLRHLISNPSLVLESMEESALDGRSWDEPRVFFEVCALKPSLPHLLDALVSFFSGALLTWERFCEEFVPGGAVAEASQEERDRAFMPRTNDANEGALGAKRVYARTHVKHSDIMFNSRKMFADNKTGEWMDTTFIDEDFAYIRRLARERDTARLQEKVDLEIAQHNMRTAEENRQKIAEKEKEEAANRALYDTAPLFEDESSVDKLKKDQLEFYLEQYRRRDKRYVDEKLKSHLKNNDERKATLRNAIRLYKSSALAPLPAQQQPFDDHDADSDHEL